MDQAADQKYGEYFTTRIFKELGIKSSAINVSIRSNQHKMITMPIFSEDKSGNIRILVYTLDRELITYDHPKATPEKPNINNNRDQTYYITRLKDPQPDKSGKLRKYYIPKGAGTHPFFPPKLIEKFERKIPINTLTLTEGYFKAFKGSIHQIDVVGLSSITHYRDKQKNTIHNDILRLIQTCKVENIIILYDGDCLDISENALENQDDLYNRPNSFFSSARSIQELLKDQQINIYFSHIKSDCNRDTPKGLDDLLISMQDDEAEVARDLSLYSKPGYYFFKMDITYSLHKLRRYFHLTSPEEFYSFHCEIIQDKEFVFNGTHYQWVENENKLKIIIPAEARLYFRVGDSYYEYVEVPNKFQNIEKKIERRLKGTLIDDHGKKFLEHVPKYKTFCNVPDHTSFNQVINNCFNIYAPFEHEPEEGNCDTTLNFLKHIFGEQLELGLDYIQLLYQKPTQILPILCLVSKENHTGKTTFAKYLRDIFTQNVTIVGNEELSASFNTTYANKLIIISEETFLDKKQIIEKIKALSTADKILMNAKGRDHIEIDFFGKFIFLSNNEENFIYASKDDIRYWVRKIPLPERVNINILEEIKQEIPQFLNFLNKRNITTQTNPVCGSIPASSKPKL
ncbi:primase-helicase family protein [Bacteroidota bacterium]